MKLNEKIILGFQLFVLIFALISLSLAYAQKENIAQLRECFDIAITGDTQLFDECIKKYDDSWHYKYTNFVFGWIT